MYYSQKYLIYSLKKKEAREELTHDTYQPLEANLKIFK